MRKSYLIFFVFTYFLLGCQSASVVVDSKKNDLHKNSDQIYRENVELQLKNAILLKTLNKNSNYKQEKSLINQPPFEQFDKLIFEQAKEAYRHRDLDRLSEAFRIMKTQSSQSLFLPRLYVWTSDLQMKNKKYNLAIITLDEFIRSYPANKFVPRALVLKAKLYEKMDLKIQANEVYKYVREKYPNHQLVSKKIELSAKSTMEKK